MNEMIQPTTRRTVLQRCLVFVAGAFGLPMASRGEAPQLEPTPPPVASAGRGAQTVRFFARRLQVHCSGQKQGELPAPTGRMHSRTELLDKPDGAKIGEFCATGLGPESPFGYVGQHEAVELQTLKLAEGTLFGIGCAAPAAQAERAQAILGGTGRFAGARGSYVIRRNPAGSSRESIEFVITLLT